MDDEYVSRQEATEILSKAISSGALYSPTYVLPSNVDPSMVPGIVEAAQDQLRILQSRAEIDLDATARAAAALDSLRDTLREQNTSQALMREALTRAGSQQEPTADLEALVTINQGSTALATVPDLFSLFLRRLFYVPAETYGLASEDIVLRRRFSGINKNRLVVVDKQGFPVCSQEGSSVLKLSYVNVIEPIKLPSGTYLMGGLRMKRHHLLDSYLLKRNPGPGEVDCARIDDLGLERTAKLVRNKGKPVTYELNGTTWLLFETKNIAGLSPKYLFNPKVGVWGSRVEEKRNRLPEEIKTVRIGDEDCMALDQDGVLNRAFRQTGELLKYESLHNRSNGSWVEGAYSYSDRSEERIKESFQLATLSNGELVPFTSNGNLVSLLHGVNGFTGASSVIEGDESDELHVLGRNGTEEQFKVYSQDGSIGRSMPLSINIEVLGSKSQLAYGLNSASQKKWGSRDLFIFNWRLKNADASITGAMLEDGTIVGKRTDFSDIEVLSHNYLACTFAEADVRIFDLNNERIFHPRYESSRSSSPSQPFSGRSKLHRKLAGQYFSDDSFAEMFNDVSYSRKIEWFCEDEDIVCYNDKAYLKISSEASTASRNPSFGTNTCILVPTSKEGNILYGAEEKAINNLSRRSVTMDGLTYRLVESVENVGNNSRDLSLVASDGTKRYHLTSLVGDEKVNMDDFHLGSSASNSITVKYIGPLTTLSVSKNFDLSTNQA